LRQKSPVAVPTQPSQPMSVHCTETVHGSAQVPLLSSTRPPGHAGGVVVVVVVLVVVLVVVEVVVEVVVDVVVVGAAVVVVGNGVVVVGRGVVVVGAAVVVGGGVVVVLGPVLGHSLALLTVKLKGNSRFMRFRAFLPSLPWYAQPTQVPGVHCAALVPRQRQNRFLLASALTWP
jgi:hypothetical protein